MQITLLSEDNGMKVPIYNWASGIEPQAFKQAKILAKLDFIL